MKKKVFVLSILLLTLIICIYLLTNKDNSKKIYKVGLAVMVQDDNGGDSYLTWDEPSWPIDGYIYNHLKTRCDNESIYWDEEDKNAILINNKNDKCIIYFDKINKVDKALDLSGNGYDGIFKGNVSIKLDDEGVYGLYFDRNESYVEIPTLPSSIDLIGGFTIEFEAKWETLIGQVRIFDFGNGYNSDNLLFSAGGISMVSDVYNGPTGLDPKWSNTWDTPLKTELNKKYKVKLIYRKIDNGYEEIIYVDDEEKNRMIYNREIVRNVDRKNNYLGKSNWTTEPYFNGYIYNFKFTDSQGNIILWYKFDK